MEFCGCLSELPGAGSCSGQCPVKVLLLCGQGDVLWGWQFPATTADKAKKLLGDIQSDASGRDQCWNSNTCIHSCSFCAASSTGIGSQVQLKNKNKMCWAGTGSLSACWCKTSTELRWPGLVCNFSGKMEKAVLLMYFSYLLKFHLAQRKGMQTENQQNLIQNIWIWLFLQFYNNVFSKGKVVGYVKAWLLVLLAAVCAPGKLKRMGNPVVKQHSSLWKGGLRDVQKESEFTSRIADFVVTGTSQLELLNSATVKKVLRTEKILLLTDT